jgi:hypothetical protein
MSSPMGAAGEKLKGALEGLGDLTVESSMTWFYIANVKLMSRHLAAVRGT